MRSPGPAQTGTPDQVVVSRFPTGSGPGHGSRDDVLPQTVRRRWRATPRVLAATTVLGAVSPAAIALPGARSPRRSAPDAHARSAQFSLLSRTSKSQPRAGEETPFSWPRTHLWTQQTRCTRGADGHTGLQRWLDLEARGPVAADVAQILPRRAVPHRG